MSEAAILAAKKYLQGSGPWKLEEIGIGADDYLVRCFAEAMEQERAAIVAWLRGNAETRFRLACVCVTEEGNQYQHELGVALEKAATAIERGDHMELSA